MKKIEALKTKSENFDLYYHGTSTEFLLSILKFGLDPSKIKKGRWRELEVGSFHRIPLQSFGGVYLSNDFMTAYASATNLIIKQDKGWQNRQHSVLLICVQANPKSFILDEDEIISAFHQSFPSSLPEIEYSSVLYAGKNPDYKHRDHYTQIINKAVDNFLGHSKIYELFSKAPEPFLTQFKKEIFDAYIMEILRRCLYSAHADTYNPDKSFRFDTLDKLAVEKDARKALVKVFNRFKFTHKWNKSDKYGIAHRSVRSFNPIKFKGKTRIVCIVEIWESKEDYKISRAIVHYGKIPDRLKKDYERSKGKFPPVYSADSLKRLARTKTEMKKVAAAPVESPYVFGPTVDRAQPNSYTMDDFLKKEVFKKEPENQTVKDVVEQKTDDKAEKKIKSPTKSKKKLRVR